MRIAIMGSGGMGGFYGGMLSRSGEDVYFIARGEHLEAIRSNGLSVKTSSVGEFNVIVNATDDPSDIGPVDLIMVCVKAYQTESVAQFIKSLVRPETVVLSVQNGLENEEKLAQAIGREHVIGCTEYVSSKIESPGVIREIFNRETLIGELDGGTSPRVDEIAKTFEKADLPVTVPEDIRASIWGKFLAISVMASVCCVTRVPSGIIFAHPETESLLWGALDEGVALAGAAGVTLPEGFVENIHETASKLPVNFRASMYHDLEAGKRIELEDLVGVLVRLGEKYNVPTPLNFAMYAALKPYAKGKPESP